MHVFYIIKGIYGEKRKRIETQFDTVEKMSWTIFVLTYPPVSDRGGGYIGKLFSQLLIGFDGMKHIYYNPQWVITLIQVASNE